MMEKTGNKKKSTLIVSLLLRILALASAVCATIVMATAHDTAEVFSIKFEAKYSYTPAFKYFVVVNAVASCYTLIVLFLPYKHLLWRLVLVLDLVITMLLATSISAAMAIGYIGKEGNTHAGWMPICDQVNKFCHHVTGALISGLAATVIYFILSLYTLHGALTPLVDLKN